MTYSLRIAAYSGEKRRDGGKRKKGSNCLFNFIYINLIEARESRTDFLLTFSFRKIMQM